MINWFNEWSVNDAQKWILILLLDSQDKQKLKDLKFQCIEKDI